MPESVARDDVRNAAGDLISALCEAIGDDPAREGLIDTPCRLADMWIEMLTAKKFVLSKFMNPGYDEMIISSGIRFVSLCEHHLLPFIGTATVAYIPAEDGYVLGLSKMARIVDMFAARLQLQERMTREIADYLQAELEPLGVAIVLAAEHMCMSIRGVKKLGHVTTTSHLTGVFRDKPETRAEFLRFVHS